MNDKNKENGILIALFMGAEYVNDAPEDFPNGYYMDKNLPLEPEDWFFHSHWDWLMPVVEKIETIVDTFVIETTTYENKDKDYVVHCSKINRLVSHTSKIEVVYNAVINFIKWYNNEKEN